MNPIEEFEDERRRDINEMSKDENLKKLTADLLSAMGQYKYTYNFKWLGRPMLQLPTDIIALQELIWEIKPDLIIETGIAHGGSIIFSASMLDVLGGDGQVIGIDIDIRKHNRIEIEKHPMFKRITMLEGSSIDNDIIAKVQEYTKNKKRVLVILDSCHTHEHVLKELEEYSKFVTIGSYIIAFDTIIEFQLPVDRPWGPGNSPWTAVEEFIKNNEQFLIDKSFENKILLTAAPNGFLKRIK